MQQQYASIAYFLVVDNQAHEESMGYRVAIQALNRERAGIIYFSKLDSCPDTLNRGGRLPRVRGISSTSSIPGPIYT